MKNKKLWARIGAVVATLLLIVALAVPCFADDAYTPTAEEIDMAFRDFIPEYMHEAYGELSAYIRDTFYFQRYFNALTIYSNDQRLPFVLGSDLNYTFSTENIDADYYIYVNYNNIAGSVFNCYFTYSFITDRGDNSFDLTLTCYSRDDDSTIFEAYYTGTTNSSAYGDYIDCSISRLTSPLYNNGERLDERYFYIGLVGAQLPYSMAMVTNLLFFNSTAVNPNDWYEGAVALAEDFYIKGNAEGREHGYSDGYDEGLELGEQSGYEYGYEQGYNFGETNGFAAGQKLGYENGYDAGLVSGDAYKAGFDEAVRQIDTGEFGRNFLGNLFNAPLQAISDFVLVEIPMGDDIPLTLTLGGAVYLIIGVSFTLWFLRTIRG